MSHLAVSGEPSAPKLEGQMGEDGNSIKVNLIKQDDGGSPIRHYLVKYRAVSGLLPQASPPPLPPEHPAGGVTTLQTQARQGLARLPGLWAPA